VFIEKMEIFPHLIKKIGCKSLADIFSKFLAIYNPEKEDIKEDYIEQRKQILEMMLNYYDTCDDFEVIF